MLDQPLSCDIVIPVYDQARYTQACVESIFAHTLIPFRLIIVDDASKERQTTDYLEDLKRHESARVLVLRLEKNQGYVGAVNHGLEKTSAQFVVVMNNDTLVYPGWLTEMICVAQKDPAIGLVNPQWEVPKRFRGRLDLYVARHVVSQRGRFIETDWVRGFCYLTKRCVIEKIGGLDEDFAPAYYDDWDYSLRAQAAGYRCVCALGAFVFHIKNATYAACAQQGQTSTLLEAKGRLFYERWGRPLKMLVVDNGSFGDLSARLRRWLQGQNKITLVSFTELEMRHTNLKIVKVWRGFMTLAVLWLLFQESLHSALKRHHLVCMTAPGNMFLRKDCRAVLISKENDLAIDKKIEKLKFS